MATEFTFDSGELQITSSRSAELKITGKIKRTGNNTIKVTYNVVPKWRMDVRYIWFGLSYAKSNINFSESYSGSGDKTSVSSGWTDVFYVRHELNNVGSDSSPNYQESSNVYNGTSFTLSGVNASDTLYFAVRFYARSYYHIASGEQVYDAHGGTKLNNKSLSPLYTPPSGLSLSISETTTTSFKVTARWTGGEGETDGACRVTVNGTSKIIDDDPVVFTGLTPNVSYSVSGELYDKKNSPSTVRDTASATAHTTITTPSGWTGVGSNNGSIWATATSSNGGSFYYQYRINNGGWSGWQNSGTFSGLTPNVSYSIQARAVSNTGGGTSGALSGTIHTTIATPNGWTGVGSNTNSVWATGTSSNGGSFYYQYRIYKNGAWSAWQNSGTFSSLSSNTNYSLQVRAVSNTGGGTSGALSGSRWTYPVIGSLTVSLQSGQEHDRINASAAASVSSSYDQYSFAINSNSWQTYGGSSTYWSGLNGNTTYTIWVKMRNTASGFESASVSRQITTWHDPLTNLKVNLVNRWFWYLLVNCSYTYTGTISKFEFDIGGQGYQNKGTSNSHSRGTTSPTGSPKLAYNTNYTCKVRVTDNHGRQYTASATYKTLDERPLYVNGVLREVKLIKSDGSVHYVTPNLLSVVQSNGTVTNMNKIINNDNRTEYR